MNTENSYCPDNCVTSGLTTSQSSSQLNIASHNEPKTSAVKQKKESDLEISLEKIRERKEGVPLLDLSFFKTQPCKISKAHNQKRCIYYHDQDRRRPLGIYTSEICAYDEKKCPSKDLCTKAHNRVEELYHPEKYKTKYCKAFF